MKKIILFLLLTLSVGILSDISAQFAYAAPGQGSTLPRVFVLGEDEQAYNHLVESYGTSSLLNVCQNDMEKAFGKWLDMMGAMEAYAQKINFDINGVKIWVHVFWSADGTIDHIAYHLKPNSRNIDQQEFTAFLSSFIKNYKFPLTTDGVNYSHYASASFPTFSKRVN